MHEEYLKINDRGALAFMKMGINLSTHFHTKISAFNKQLSEEINTALDAQAKRNALIENGLEEIVNHLCKTYGVTIDDLRRKDRKREILDVRHSIIYLLINSGLGIGPSMLGRLLWLDHSTILHANKRVSDLLFVNDSQVMASLDKGRTVMDNLLLPPVMQYETAVR